MGLGDTVGKILTKLYDNTLVPGVEVAVPVVVRRKANLSYDPDEGEVNLGTDDGDLSITAMESEYSDFTIFTSNDAIRKGDIKLSFHGSDLPNGINSETLITRGGKTFKVEHIDTTTNPFDASDVLFYECQCRQV